MKEGDNCNLPDLGEDQSGVPKAPAPALELKPAAYLSDLDGIDISEREKTELLETLWSIMRTFVELGFEAETCEQILACAGLIPEEESDGAIIPPSTSGEKPSDDGKEGRA